MTTITLSGIDLATFKRGGIQRTSGGDIYVPAFDQTTGDLVMFKSSNGGTSFAEQDAGNGPAYTGATISDGAAVFVSGDNAIYCFFYSATGTIQVVAFSTSADTWGTPATVHSGDPVAGGEFSVDADVDANGDVHVVFVGNAKIKGTQYNECYYSNNIAGGTTTFKSAVVFNSDENNTNGDCGNVGICISDEALPEIMAKDGTSQNAYLGNALNATSFTEETAIDVISSTASQSGEIIVDSSGNTYIVTSTSTGILVLIRLADGASWTTGWGTPVESGDDVGPSQNISVTRNGDTLYVIYANTVAEAGDVVRQLYDGSWDTETLVADVGTAGTRNPVFYYQSNDYNPETNMLDLVYMDAATDIAIIWDQIDISGGETGAVSEGANSDESFAGAMNTPQFIEAAADSLESVSGLASAKTTLI